jgi:trimethylamine--corrinoid protein Co-methyltransferase
VRDGITVCDALSNINFVMSMFLPGDVDNRISDRYQMEVMLNHTTKPIVIVTYEMSGLIDTIEMAEAAADGATALREKPFVACYINVTTGLLHNQDALQKLLYLADKNLPALWIPVTSGATGGAMAGNLALNNAGCWSAGAVGFSARCAVIIRALPATRSILRRWLSICEPDHRGIATSMAHYYGLPCSAWRAAIRGGESAGGDRRFADDLDGSAVGRALTVWAI